MSAPRSVLHLSAYDDHGGSARSAYRLHTGMRAAGLTSRMIVGEKVTDDPDVREISRGTALRTADWIYRKTQNLVGLPYLMFPSSLLFLADRWVRRADIVQMYNLHGDYFAFTVLPALTNRKRVVWRLSDMWPLTGHCGYSHDCERWRTGCGACPYLKEYPALSRDTTSLLFRIKSAVYSRSRLTLVAPSRWMERLARESPLLSQFPIHYIPNGIDTAFFAPEDKSAARRALGLDPDRPVVALHDPGPGGERKGRALLRGIVDRLTARSSPNLIVFGPGGPAWGIARGIVALGPLQREEIRRVFSAADLFVFPALSENLPNIVLESMACGTPVVAFPTGGIVDAVESEVTGALVAERTGEALADVAEGLLAAPDRLAALSRAARARVSRDFPAELERNRFLDLYDRLSEGA